jgi:replicative DNA helicase
VAEPPHSPEVEGALIGRLLREPGLTGGVVGTLLESRHFYTAAHQLLYAQIVERFFADEAVEPGVIAELNAKTLSKLWLVPEREAIERVLALPSKIQLGTSPLQAAGLVKRDADYRDLLVLADQIVESVALEEHTPEEIAGITGQTALQIATAQALTQDIVSFADAGRAFVREARQDMAARKAGIELGAYFGLNAIDNFTLGLRPGELLIGGGEPGVGKSAVWWRAALAFAERQQARPEGQRVGAMVISLEMGPSPSNARFASMLSGVRGATLREGAITTDQLDRVIKEWRERVETPLWLNYAPTLRASQLRALISEAIRRHNVGLVVIDHFRMFDLDKRLPNKIDEDEEKVRFLKEQLARTLNVAVICLAHTRKPETGLERPAAHVGPARELPSRRAQRPRRFHLPTRHVRFQGADGRWRGPRNRRRNDLGEEQAWQPWLRAFLHGRRAHVHR